MDAAVTVCAANGECNDGRYCNGTERCEPGSETADARGCIAGTSPCTGGATCDEAAGACTAPGCDEPDRDADGHDAIACGGDDCDDADSNRCAGNPEVCDPERHDEDCDPTTFGGIDIDADGFESASCCNGDSCGPDCDDLRRDVHPGAVELCNAIDDDCDGSVDEPGSFCPTGICIDSRCRAVNWEWVFGSDSDDEPFGLAVDRSGNVYAGVFLAGDGGDADSDGAPEPLGFYIVSIAADGRIRWLSPVALGSGFVLASSGDSIVTYSGSGIGGGMLSFLRASDGAPDGSMIVSPPSGYDRLSVYAGALVGEDAVLAARAFEAGGTRQAALLVSIDPARSERVRRLVESPSGDVRVTHVDGARRYLGVSMNIPAPLDLGTGPLPGGEVIAVLNDDLSTRWAIEGGSDLAHQTRDIAVSDGGEAALVGGFSADWSPAWGGPSRTVSGPGDAFLASFDADGAHRWTRVHADSFESVSFDGRGNVFVSGAFSGAMDVAPRGRIGSAANACSSFFALWGAVDGDRFTLDAREIATSACDSVYGVAADLFGGLIVFGRFTGSVTLPSGTGYDSEPFPGTSFPSTDLYLLRISDL